MGQEELAEDLGPREQVPLESPVSGQQLTEKQVSRDPEAKGQRRYSSQGSGGLERVEQE